MLATGATLFSGFGGVEIGMVAAGITPLWGIEYDPAIAAVARDNGHPVITADILEANPADFPAVDVLHASPPCPNFSQAKTDAGETEEDIALATAVCWFITTLQPKVFTLENVYGYRKSISFSWIEQVLNAGGYHVRWWHLNSADYGVPQTRKRLVLVAALDFVPRKPVATHCDPSKTAGQLPLFSPLRTWVGWYEAVEDLIPALPDSQFADWQLRRLPEWMHGSLIGTDGTAVQSFLVDPNNPSRDSTVRLCGEPMVTINATHMRRPITTPKAFVVDSRNGRNYEGQNLTIRDTSQPIYTIHTGGPGRHRVLMPTGRVVQMTPRALARFQSFPDSYQFPDNTVLACKGIGNAMPPLLYQRVIEAQRC